MFYWTKTNRFIKKIFSNYIWDIPNTENKIYLTFDDGPTPEITEWVLLELEKYDAKATFFCIGHNVEKHPEIVDKLLDHGHSLGNHTFNHLNGWKTTTDEYLENVKLFESLISNPKYKIFRPPYGKIRASQAKKLREMGYKIIMWDVLSADFDTNISGEKCLENATKKVTSGSILVFHDSLKAFPHLEVALPKALKHYKEKGFVFEKLS